MPETDLALLTRAVEAAGEIALGFSGPEAKRWEKDDGAGPVTEADLAVDAALSETLRAARPDYGWLSEETEDDTDRLGRDRVFIIDPIDGTRSFVAGEKTWAIAVAVAEKGRITAAAVYLPMRERLFAAGLGQGATLNGAPLSVEGHEPPMILAAKPNFKPEEWPGGVPDHARHYRPSLAYRMALVGTGRFSAMLTLRRSWEWDIAAGSLIVSEAGGTVSNRLGADLRFNNAEPLLDGVVAAAPEVHRNLLERLNPGRT